MRMPTCEQIAAISEQLRLDCSPGDIDQLSESLPAYLADIEAAERLWTELVDADRARSDRSFRIPTPQENPLNAWTVVCSIETGAAGLLQGRSIAIKDNIAVAGLPLSGGSDMLLEYVAERDATVVSRVLDAGATIQGMSRCENFCLSGGSHTGYGGPVRNTIDAARTTGGSSSGSAALVASGAVDMAIGSDQGGSVRIPSSFSGIVGLKPTWGKVPYTGAMSLEPNVDHLGPMTRTVLDNLLLHTVLAGENLSRADCSSMLAEGAGGIRIGRLVEGFGQPNGDADVERAVNGAIDDLALVGAVVQNVSVPTHRIAPVLWTAVGLAGLRHGLLNNDAWGVFGPGNLPPEWLKRFRLARQVGLSAALRTKQFLVAAAIIHQERGLQPYAFSRKAATVLRSHYDKAFESVDILAMPTTPHTAHILPNPDDLKASNFASESMASNTAPFNLTHHPALSVPCGSVGGLPVGLMMVGRHGQEHMLFRVAAAVERQQILGAGWPYGSSRKEVVR